MASRARASCCELQAVGENCEYVRVRTCTQLYATGNPVELRTFNSHPKRWRAFLLARLWLGFLSLLSSQLQKPYRRQKTSVCRADPLLSTYINNGSHLRT